MIFSGNENIVEIKHMLLCTKLELVKARKEANKEIKKYEDTIKSLFKLLKRVSQERDEAKDKLQFLLRNFHQPNSPEAKSTTIPQIGHSNPPKVKNNKVLELSSKPFSNCSFGYQVSQRENEKHCFMETSHARNTESSNLALTNQQNYQNKHGIIKVDISTSSDNTSLVIDKLDWEKPLPQKGRQLETVTEAQQLLQTLPLVPLPQWQKPHSLSSSCSDFSTKVYDKESVNQNSVILTSLSLAFPRNSCGPSHMSCEKIEPVLYEDMGPCRIQNHNHVLTGKKRKLF